MRDGDKTKGIQKKNTQKKKKFKKQKKMLCPQQFHKKSQVVDCNWLL